MNTYEYKCVTFPCFVMMGIVNMKMVSWVHLLLQRVGRSYKHNRVCMKDQSWLKHHVFSIDACASNPVQASLSGHYVLKIEYALHLQIFFYK